MTFGIEAVEGTADGHQHRHRAAGASCGTSVGAAGARDIVQRIALLRLLEGTIAEHGAQKAALRDALDEADRRLA